MGGVLCPTSIGSVFLLRTETTLNALRDPSKRPREPQTPVPRELSSPEPRSLFNLEEIGPNLRSARRGSRGTIRNGGTFATAS